MARCRPISILLAALLFGQAVLAGWGHSHCHHHATAIAGHSHADGHTHRSHDPEELPPVQIPTDEDDCTLCRHLAESSLLTIDIDLASASQITIFVLATDDSLPSRDIVGLRRPRSPPLLG
ncbi:MAG TPA: hypothetical protein QF564_14920 [Pirellulaceae bacterium]|nr:hypothetical protein [Pirellulaceae bacterium]